ncbi:hypothetical protein [Cyanobium sp. N5-Cardenillas]|uniref:hypothetical protein n=1 Tax=Cyanobium sp. N5-Cardenillas TaxID=2823720 RepID=UPI0020CB8067|nr:hypothetical protein [Cyanobium sp. N5-Cardenillas]MCP9786143.1 HupE/UreJ family protein [Cyanobium sp. N5-Cardenillas]
MSRLGRLSRRGWTALAAVAAMASLVAVPPALAHALPAGLGAVLKGAAQLVFSPADLLLVCGLCALAVQNGAEPGSRLRLVLPTAWLMGGAVGLGLPAKLATSWSSTVAFTLVGLLVALAVPLGQRLTTALAGVGGLVCGLAHGSSLALHSGAPPALAGGAIAVALITTTLTLALRPPHPDWMRVGLRVVGSWIAASGLLSLGWLLKGPS